MLTDQAAGLPILERNAGLNAEVLRAASCQPPTVHKLTWLDYITTATATTAIVHLHHQHVWY